MAISQNFKTQVVFGGRIDPSFKRSSEDLKDAVRQTSQVVGQLTKRQEKLKGQIAAAKLAGRDVSSLTKQYQKLDRQIKEVSADQEKLNKQMARQQRLDKWAGRAKGAAKGAARWGAGKAIGGVGSSLKWGAAGAVGAAIGIPAAALAMNAQTAEKLGLARSYGVGIDKYAAWDNIGKMAGLNGENVGDLTEELTNKIGEAGNEQTVNPMLLQIGLSKKMMRGWSREKQFDEVMNRLSKMKDDKVAASLADQLMGGEANKIMTYMRITGKTWEETMAEAQKSNLLTKEGAEGAARAHFAVTNLWSALTSGLADTLGKVSNDLAPTFDTMRDDAIAWFKDNQGALVDSIKTWLNPENLKKLWEGVISFGEGCVKFGKIIWEIVKKLEWILPDENSEAEEKIYNDAYSAALDEGMKNGYGVGDPTGMAVMNYAKLKAEKAVEDAREQKKQEEQAKENEKLASAGEIADVYGRYTIAPSQNNKFEININAGPGTDPQAIGKMAYEGAQQAMRESQYNLGSGAMWDTPLTVG
ncbi:hypothetical protein CBK19_24710 [Salmonella enterica subsp. enterica serovar Hillingdon]|uniref:hypothetical protein n=1 Tax=Salmonella enterica TaxID=28901 RepID=UPI0009AF71CF|nr:hypothetical protein [Salmonella enterica]EBG0214452.1 hypothetical protein [Salmonella enterica subsp. enterica serovar Louisiana]EBW2268847.1 hypothetical protein [Salmonella enterica subsp. enterica serovar Hillingdon]EDR0865913.1 hypothetical protein [Salmonella enterica subsp. enterica serovar Hillingdon]